MSIHDDLKAALREERYEDAARLRDLIRGLESPNFVSITDNIDGYHHPLSRNISSVMQGLILESQKLINDALKARIMEIEGREPDPIEIATQGFAILDHRSQCTEWFWKGQKVLRVVFDSLPPTIIAIHEHRTP